MKPCYYSLSNNYGLNEIQLCVSVTKTKIPNQFHIGFLFRNSKNEVKYLHLAWYEKLLYDDFPCNKNMIWLDISLDCEEIVHFIWFLENIVKENGCMIPYGISNDIEFDINGLIIKNQFSGLTCATFVLKVCNALGYHIIDTVNWKTRPEDSIWQDHIIQYLKNSCSDEYIKYQQSHIGNVPRYQPTEVAVAASSKNRPLQQNVIINKSQLLITIINNL